MTLHDLYASGDLPPELALFAVAGVLFTLGAVIVMGFVRAHRRELLARAAEASVSDHPPPLVEGSDVVLVGTVQHFEDHDVAVKVSVHQNGTESESSGSWSHAWVEIDREIILAPFLLELANGQKVLVHPPKNVDVADALDQKVWIDRNRRVLSAELVPGERIFARGRLQRSDQAVPGAAYRDVQWGWALHPSGGQMLLSSEPLGAGLRQRAAFHRYYAWVAVVVLFITHLTLIGYYGRMLGSTRIETTSERLEWETTDDDGDTHMHCGVNVDYREIEIPCGNFVQKDDQTYVRVGFGGNWELGSRATIHWLHATTVALTAFIVWLVYRARRRSSRPWFRRKVNETGGGQLPDPPRG